MQFDVTPEEANLIGAALAEQPYRISAALIAKLQAQAQEQISKKDEEKQE